MKLTEEEKKVIKWLRTCKALKDPKNWIVLELIFSIKKSGEKKLLNELTKLKEIL